MDRVTLAKEVRVLLQQYRSLSGRDVCVRCGVSFVLGSRDEACRFHSGDLNDGDGEESCCFFTCCHAHEDVYWGGTPLYTALLPLVAKGPVFLSSGGCCRTQHVGILAQDATNDGGDGDGLPDWKLRLMKRRLSSLVDDCQRLQETDRQQATRVIRGMHNALWDVADGITFFSRQLNFITPSSQGSSRNDAPIINTGLRIWDGAIVLAKYLEHKYAHGHWYGKRVLEVGAGCGLVGLALGTQGAHVVLTDREEVIPTLEENVQKNINSWKTDDPSMEVDISVKELDWRKDASAFVEDGGYDYIMAADVIGFPAVLDILANTLHTLMFSSSVTRKARCVMSFKERDARVESSFLYKMLRKGFNMSEVAQSDMHPDFRADTIRIVIFTPGERKEDEAS